MPLRRGQEAHVYFLRNCETGRIKIGVSLYPGSRAEYFQSNTDCELEELGFVPGCRDDELAWHRRFSHLRHRNEWFNPGDDLQAEIKRCVDASESLWGQALAYMSARLGVAESKVSDEAVRQLWRRMYDEFSAGELEEPPCRCPRCKACLREHERVKKQHAKQAKQARAAAGKEAS